MAGAALLVGLTSCGSDSSEGSATTEADPTTTAAGSTGETGGYPATVATIFGDVVIEEAPERIVALGWSDAEAALALGVQPVAATDWLAFGDEGVGPWLDGAYEEAPEILETTFDYEAILALEPDLILNTVSDGTEEIHEQLSAIAPTIGIPEGGAAWGTPWQLQIQSIARALDKVEEGEALIADTDQAFADAAAANPDFEGKTVAIGARFDGQWGAYVSKDTRVQFMEQLGFVNKPEIESQATESFYFNVSAENVDLFDADLTVMFPLSAEDAPDIEADPLLSNIPAAQDGRMVVFDDADLIRAFSSNSALATQWALDQAVPIFAAALG